MFLSFGKDGELFEYRGKSRARPNCHGRLAVVDLEAWLIKLTRRKREIANNSDDLTVSSWCLRTVVEDACALWKGSIVVQVWGVHRADSAHLIGCAYLAKRTLFYSRNLQARFISIQQQKLL